MSPAVSSGKERGLLSRIAAGNRAYHAQTYPRKSSRLRSLCHWRFHNNYGLWCNRLQGVHKSYVAVVSCCATNWLRVYSRQWINKDYRYLQTRNVKVDVWVITFSLLCVKCIFLALSKRWIRREYYGGKKKYYVSQIMRWRSRFHFRCVTNNILLTLQVYFVRSISH